MAEKGRRRRNVLSVISERERGMARGKEMGRRRYLVQKAATALKKTMADREHKRATKQLTSKEYRSDIKRRRKKVRRDRALSTAGIKGA
jgi:translation elongation factor EF-4